MSTEAETSLIVSDNSQASPERQRPNQAMSAAGGDHFDVGTAASASERAADTTATTKLIASRALEVRADVSDFFARQFRLLAFEIIFQLIGRYDIDNKVSGHLLHVPITTEN